MESMKHRDTFEAQRIDQLKVEIEQVENEIVRSQHYRRQLEHMLNRLKHNQVRNSFLSSFFLPSFDIF